MQSGTVYKYLLNWSLLITNICLIFMLISYLPGETYGDFLSGQECWFDFSNFIVRCQNCNLLIYFLKHMVIVKNTMKTTKKKYKKIIIYSVAFQVDFYEIFYSSPCLILSLEIIYECYLNFIICYMKNCPYY